MMRSRIFGRRIHITGSIPKMNEATTADAERARTFIEHLVKRLMKCGATFVLPVDAEKHREDGVPFCFDWLIWTTIGKNLHLRPNGAPAPFAIAVKHDKNDAQIPEEHQPFWDSFGSSDNVSIDSAAHWNMNSKRMEIQARHGEILIAVGGGEGVLFLANAYHDAGKPVIPVDFPVSAAGSGTHKLCEFASNAGNASRLFKTTDGISSLTWLNRITPSPRSEIDEIVDRVSTLLAALERPTVFAIRLLNPNVPEFDAVQAFFETVVKPVVEEEYGFSLVVVDGIQAVEAARIDQDIFTKLRRGSLVIADLTGSRPNCFLELGYALGRNARTIVTARDGTAPPFDITTYAAHIWEDSGDVLERRAVFRAHLVSVRDRPPIVSDTTLIQ
jgi:hypothetical protein